MKAWNESFGRAENRWQLAGWLLAFAFPVLALVVDKAASTIYAIFFLAGLWLLITQRFEKPSPEVRWVLFAFAAYFLVGVLSFFLGDEQTRLGEKILGRDIRFLAAFPIAVAICKLAIPPRLLEGALGIGGVVTGLTALLQVVLSESNGYRASGETISILFGHLSAALFALNIALTFGKKSHFRRLTALGALFSLVAVALSLTRGALLAAAIVFMFVIVFNARRYFKEMLLVFLLFAAVAISLSFTPAGVLLANRFAELDVDVFAEKAMSPPQLDFDQSVALGCRNDEAFLDWLRENSLIGGKGRITARVVALETSALEQIVPHSCTSRVAIHLENASTGTGWIYFPPRNVPPVPIDGGAVLIRGKGYAGLSGAPANTRVRINSADFDKLVFLAQPSSTTRHLFLLKPGESLQVIPLLTQIAEYEFEPMGSGRLRLAMWEAAIRAFVQEPWVGHGTGTYPTVMAERAQSGVSAWQLAEFDHPHNEFLAVATERGIPGILALVFVYGAVFRLFLSRRDPFRYAGMALVGAVVVSGLTETIFNHSLGITYYCMLIVLLATASDPREAATD